VCGGSKIIELFIHRSQLKLKAKAAAVINFAVSDTIRERFGFNAHKSDITSHKATRFPENSALCLLFGRLFFASFEKALLTFNANARCGTKAPTIAGVISRHLVNYNQRCWCAAALCA
jgi:hypothetical protein